jgi:predicted RNA-binding Zn ribbon-like protein
MSGESTSNPAARQPGGRQPAPGRLALVQAFLNTRFNLTADDHGETFTDPEALVAWLASRGLVDEPPDLREEDLVRAIAVREGLRALAFANNGRPLAAQAVTQMRKASSGLQVEVRLGSDGPEFLAGDAGGVEPALGRLIAVAARAKIEGTWQRLKACPGRNCGWVFFDHSRNGGSRWCSMRVCGDREKSRALYWRRAEHRG